MRGAAAAARPSFLVRVNLAQLKLSGCEASACRHSPPAHRMLSYGCYRRAPALCCAAVDVGS